MKKPAIVFVGHVVIDQNQVEQTSYTRWGSPAMFMTKYFQLHFGLEPTIVASYGADFLPFADGVNLLPSKPNLARSIVYENIVTDGHRTQYCHQPDAALPVINRDVISTLRAADILFLAPLTPSYSASYVTQVMQHVPKGCLKVLSPQGYLRHIGTNGLIKPRDFVEAADILPCFNVVILSDEDHPQADTQAHIWKVASPNTEIIITLNSRGADIIQPHGVQHIPTVPVPPEEITDSTGLGDVFSAAVAYYLRRGDSLVAAVQSAHEAAREKLLQPKTS